MINKFSYTLKKLNNSSFLRYKNHFSKSDKIIFPLINNPNFYKLLEEFYTIVIADLEVGVLYVLSETYLINSVQWKEVGLYVFQEYRNMRIGKRVIKEFLANNTNYFICVSTNNKIMNHIVSDSKCFSIIKEKNKNFKYYSGINK